ncbi:MAG: arylsulfatase [SAR324 cluster bacterium]|nr:arylsulfatase [SAR324 cluster bacterium]
MIFRLYNSESYISSIIEEGTIMTKSRNILKMRKKRNKILAKMLIATVFAASTMITSCADSEKTEKTDNRMNIVTIVVDDMGFSELGPFGGEVPTPNIDALAEKGTVLSNFYTAPTSGPSRAMFFTGKDNHLVGQGNLEGYTEPHPGQHGQPGYEGYLRKEAITFPEVLQGQGYHTMMVGKWDEGEKPDLDASKRGFTETDALLIYSGDSHWVSNAYGDNISTFPPGKHAALGRTNGYNKNGVPYPKNGFPPNTYATQWYTDKAMELIDNRELTKPFYLNLAYFAPHFPLQAPAETIAKYIDTYSKGWDVIRAARFEKQKALGILDSNAELPPRWEASDSTNFYFELGLIDDYQLKPWDQLTPEQQKIEAKRYAINAAMLEILDTEIGRLIQKLKDIGEYENTMIIMVSDNGAGYITAGNITYRKANFTGLEDYDNMGSATSYIDYSYGWTQVASTPFNKHKVTTYDGGMHVPAMIFSPKATVSGNINKCILMMQDLAPTILEAAGVLDKYPDHYMGQPNSPMQGKSLTGVFDGSYQCDENRIFGMELNGVKGFRKGDWKLSQDLFEMKTAFHLYNLKDDPSEVNDLSTSTDPEIIAKFEEMKSAYYEWADANNVVDIENLRPPIR